jgi:hypothetical protein
MQSLESRRHSLPSILGKFYWIRHACHRPYLITFILREREREKALGKLEMPSSQIPTQLETGSILNASVLDFFFFRSNFDRCWQSIYAGPATLQLYTYNSTSVHPLKIGWSVCHLDFSFLWNYSVPNNLMWFKWISGSQVVPVEIVASLNFIYVETSLDH